MTERVGPNQTPRSVASDLLKIHCHISYSNSLSPYHTCPKITQVLCITVDVSRKCWKNGKMCRLPSASSGLDLACLLRPVSLRKHAYIILTPLNPTFI